MRLRKKCWALKQSDPRNTQVSGTLSPLKQTKKNPFPPSFLSFPSHKKHEGAIRGLPLERGPFLRWGPHSFRHRRAILKVSVAAEVPRSNPSQLTWQDGRQPLHAFLRLPLLTLLCRHLATTPSRGVTGGPFSYRFFALCVSSLHRLRSREILMQNN